MGFIIIGGGNYGSEGKGKVSAYLAEKYNAAAACRVGGPNSGHTVYIDGKPCKLRMLPTAAVKTGCDVIYPAGSYINVDILLDEINTYDIDKSRVFIDTNAVILDSADVDAEKNLKESIASTMSGTGNGVIRRISRTSAHILARHCPRLHGMVANTKRLLQVYNSHDQCVILEGTQGYLLSILHSEHYPYCTGRDTSAAGILSEVGGNVHDVDKVVTVFRTYPIRVGGNSGPLENECSWNHVTNVAGCPEPIMEYTTVTNRLRRVGEFSMSEFMMVCQYEKPDIIVMNHLDYIDWKGHDAVKLTMKQQRFIDNIQQYSGYKVNICGTGPDTFIDIT